MSLLALLWESSLAMTLAAVAWMFGLIIARLLRERSDARRAADQTRVRTAFLDILGGDLEALMRLKPYRRRARLMAEAVLDVLGLIRGAERERLIEVLGGMGVADRLRTRLDRGSKAGRIASAEALSAFPESATVDVLHSALQRTRDDDLRVAILISLLDLDAAPPLNALLDDVAARGLQDSLLYEPVIRRAAEAAPAEAVDAFMLSTAPAVTRAVLADALGAAGDYRAVEPLMQSAAMPELEVRIASLRALGVLGHPAAGLAIMTAMKDEIWEVRSAACEAIGRIGLIEAAPLLVQALSDPAWWVRFRAGEALAALGDKGIASLRIAAGTDQDLMRRAASLVLAERGLLEGVA